MECAIGDYANDIGAEVVWFPVTIHLKDANGDSTKVFLEVGTNSRKIALTKNDGTTELKGEIEGWNYDAGTPANSTGFIHTSADGWTINANTSIWLYYDNDHADNANVDVINTAAGAAVWDDNFKTVQHKVDATTSTIKDSTFNNNDGTKFAANQPVEATGVVGKAQDYDGNDDYINLSNNSNLDITGNLTVEAIVNVEAFPAGGAPQYGVCRLVDRKGTSIGYSFFILTTAIGLDCSGQADNTSSKVTTISTSTDYYVAASDNAGTVSFYHNGTALGTDTKTSGYLTGSVDCNLGRYRAGDMQYMNGIMDEVRVSDTNRTAAWLKGTYNSLWDTLLTYGSEETSVVTNAIFFGANF